ncbi:MAG: ATP-binding protein, partial [Calditrichaceae bacterium]
YLRENDFAVILANIIENAYNLAKSMKPDLILWGESLSVNAKQILLKIKATRIGSIIPVIALMPDMELFDRIEVEKYGINDVTDTLPNFAELKLKIRFLLANRRRMKMYEEEVERLQNISALQYNMIRTQDIARVCELVGDYIFQTYKPETFITLVYNDESNEYDYRNIIFADTQQNSRREPILQLPVWKNYFISKTDIDANRIADDYILNVFNASGMASDIFYQFPLRSSGKQIGVIIIGFESRRNLSKEKFNEISILASSLASRVFNMRSSITGKTTIREDTAEISTLFQRLNEDEVSNYLCCQLLETLKADASIYLNYNEGFRFLYPQYCYLIGREDNLFEDEKPPVMMLKDYPTLENFIESKKSSAQFSLRSNEYKDFINLASLAGERYRSLLIFSVKVGNEIKGFFVLLIENGLKRFTQAEINDAEQMIQKATNVLIESRLIRQAQKTLKQLDRIFELSKQLSLETEIDELLKNIAHAIRKTLGWNVVILDRREVYSSVYKNVCYLGLKDNEYTDLRKRYPNSMYPTLKSSSFKISNSYFYTRSLSSDSMDGKDQRAFLLSLGKEWNDEDWIYIPIRSRGRELGVISVNDPVERIRPTEDKVRSLEYFANQAAVALENAALYENLRDSENKYRLLAETIVMGLITCDTSGRIIYVNESLTNILRYGMRESLIDQNIFDLCSSKTRNDFEKEVIRLFKKDKELAKTQSLQEDGGIAIELLANDNHYIPFKIYLTEYKQPDSKNGFLGVLSDLRPQRRLERLKADFNSMIVHDLRSPLNIIQGYIDIIRNNIVGTISEEQSELLFIAKENVDKILKLIDNFLTASKLEAGKFAIEREIDSINSLIEAIYEHHKVLAEKKDITMKINLDPDIELMKFDKMRIEQVLSNYLSNAIKFTGKSGTIEISSKLVKKINELTGDEKLTVHVAVKDSGVGIPEEEQAKVFSKYEQTEAGKDSSLKGTGLGLAICKEIIYLHNGDVWLESVPGEGSTFYFSLPVSKD